MPFIELKNLSYAYQSADGKKNLALDNVNLSVAAGEFVAILGANGSGKSTLAKHLNALLLPTAGHCLIDGQDTRQVSDLFEVRKQVGMVFQNPDNQIIAAVVEDDVAFGPENLGLAPEKIRQRVTEALRAVGMEKCRGLAPHLLSGGQKQRLAIAGALAMATKCLVLDEPTAMLDPQGRDEVMLAVKRLNCEQKMTIVYITHFMEEAAQASRVVVMNKGKIVLDGKAAEVLIKRAEMLKCGLSVPPVVEMANGLRACGVTLPPDVYTEEDLVSALVGR